MPPFFRLSAVATVAVLSACAVPAPVPMAPSTKVADMEFSASEGPAPASDIAPILEEAPMSLAAPRLFTIARRGVVTAGDIDDRLNLNAFQRYQIRAAQQTGLPRLTLGVPVLATLTGPFGQLAPGLRYTLRRPGADAPFHEGYSGPGGRIADFPQVLGAKTPGAIELRVFDSNASETARARLNPGHMQTIRLQTGATWTPDFLDLVLVVDTTGSMGDEIDYLERELIGITRKAAQVVPGLSVRYGLVAYRDDGDAYVVKTFGFTPRAGQMNRWLRGLSADGGGDYPEAAADALAAGMKMNWRRGKGERLILHVADAPPHDRDAVTYLRVARDAAQEGVQIFTLGASGVGASSEFLMRQASVATGGRYLFLTDDSGVGASHAEPTIPCYQVTRLSQLLTRILLTELTGKRQEAQRDDVIREVGSYDAGVCRN